MTDWVIYLILLAAGAMIALIAVFVGAWIMFRGRTPTQSFFADKSEDGGAYVIPDPDAPAFPLDEPNEHEKQVLKKTESFLHSLTGKGVLS